MKTKFQQLIELAFASTEVTVEVQCFISNDKAQGIKDFSMCDIDIKAQPKAECKTDFMHGNIPLDWLAI